MAVKLVKGGNVSLTQLAPDTDVFNVLLGLKARSELRFGAFCFMLATDGKVLRKSNYDKLPDEFKFLAEDKDQSVWFLNRSSIDEAVQYLGSLSNDEVKKQYFDSELSDGSVTKDEIMRYYTASNTAESFADADAFSVDLSKISSDVTRLVFALGIFPWNEDNFAQVSSCSMIVADDSNSKLASFELSDTMPAKAIILGELYRYKGQWKFRALGAGFNDDVIAMFDAYGAQDLLSWTGFKLAMREHALHVNKLSQQAAPTPVPSSNSGADQDDHDDRALNASNTAQTADHSLCVAMIGGLAIGYLLLLRLIEFGLFVLLLLSPIILIVWLV